MLLSRRNTSIGALLTSALLLTWWMFQSETSLVESPLFNTSRAYLQGSIHLPGETATSGKPLGKVPTTAQEWDSWLYHESSLRHATMDGDWGHRGPNGWVPSVGLRMRFDQFTTLLGELDAANLRQMVLSLAQRELGDDAASVMTLWDQYTTLSQRHLQTKLDGFQADQLMALFKERQAVRQQILGVETARVFFAEEDAHFIAAVQRIQDNGKLEPPAAWAAPADHVNAADLHQLRSQTYGEEAAHRLALLDQEEKEWARSVSNAHIKRNQLMAQPELSDLQRQSAFQNYMNEHFQVKDHIRVKALVGM
jgi:lipase chaperone LimK